MRLQLKKDVIKYEFDVILQAGKSVKQAAVFEKWWWKRSMVIKKDQISARARKKTEESKSQRKKKAEKQKAHKRYKRWSCLSFYSSDYWFYNCIFTCKAYA